MENTNTITYTTKPTFCDYYNDGLIDYRVSVFSKYSDDALAIFANIDGESKTVKINENLFAPIDLVKAYKELFKDDYADNKDEYVRAFCNYLIESGCDPEELEEA